MRINKFVALATGMSRRAADRAVEQGSVTVNGQVAAAGSDVSDADEVTLDASVIQTPASNIVLMLNKPAGYVVSREGQGSRTIYELLPRNLHHLKPVGRLDKDSSGLLLLTNDGNLANELTHPRYEKQKIYQVEINKPLAPDDIHALEKGVNVEDYISSMRLSGEGTRWEVTIHQGKNRQIRKTFQKLGYEVTKLHRTHFGEYTLGSLKPGHHTLLNKK